MSCPYWLCGECTRPRENKRGQGHWKGKDIKVLSRGHHLILDSLRSRNAYDDLNGLTSSQIFWEQRDIAKARGEEPLRERSVGGRISDLLGRGDIKAVMDRAELKDLDSWRWGPHLKGSRYYLNEGRPSAQKQLNVSTTYGAASSLADIFGGS